MTFRTLALASIGAVFLCSPIVSAQRSPIVPPVVPQVVPQETVECTGWHALCSLADDCSANGECDCWRVNENYVVATSNIKNDQIRATTQRRCTNKNPCGVDEAPVCTAIQSGQFTVAGVAYPWISTYSYRGWCENWDPVKCTDGNQGAGAWADCMTSPCWENSSGTDRPLTCACTINHGEFVGTNGSCVAGGGAGNMMSTIPLHSWNFPLQTFTFDMPGYEYVKGACSAIHSSIFP
jgi:hypothetical protein